MFWINTDQNEKYHFVTGRSEGVLLNVTLHSHVRVLRGSKFTECITDGYDVSKM